MLLDDLEMSTTRGHCVASIHLSARAPDPRVHVGDLLRKTFDDVGSAGGHHDVAGGEIPLGLFADFTSDDDMLLAIVEQVITARLLAELDL